MTKSKKKREPSRDGITQPPWLLTSLERIQAQSQNAILFETYQPDGTIHKQTRQKIAQTVLNLANAFTRMDVRSNQRIAIDASLSWETCAVWLAALMIGAIPVFYPTDMRFRDKRAAVEQDLGDQQCPLLIVVSTPNQAKLWLEASGLPTPHVICLQSKTADNQNVFEFFDGEIPNQIHLFKDIIHQQPSDALTPVRVTEDEPVAYVYTQGSHTGTARRIAISHAHLRAQAEDLQNRFNIHQNSKLYIDLLSAHAASLSIVATAFFTGSAMLMHDPAIRLLEIHHHIDTLTHVFLLPSSIQSILNDILFSNHKWLCELTFKLAKYRNRHKVPWLRWPNSSIKRHLIIPMKNKNFPYLEALVSYGNHFDSKAADRISWLDIRIYNAFTIGELGFIHIHEFKKSGSFLKSIEARIKSGILSVKSSRINSSFIQTDDLVFEDDQCGLCAHRSSPITLENDVTVDTSPIRDILKRNEYIEEIFIYGEQRPFLTALIYINENAIKSWAQANHLENQPFDELTQNELFYTYIRSIVDRCNHTRSAQETIQKIALINRPLHKDPHIVSPCGLTCFKEIEHRYRAMLESFYQNDF